ncbi:putative DNA-binding protein [Sporosarcina sp. Marseille-Q4063]|uniref:putative DNA-binding protein n=1 Tax=Sporosarcina sp. Marseille-Q4063 TaxID=2810514 RepID=UPI001BAF2F6C|nr:putative DNA-binding protein [Sporosarcina sp. Marseille-Q4063]QUW21849.1 putative DNA-binding protein [Sporosarcina sp. Marseille-Q4063]
MALIKTTRINFLFDFYQSLLTDKQRTYMDLYYLEDLSLGEIAEEYGISRQAVYDNVRRTEVMLEDYELKLNLFSKFQQRLEIIGDMEKLLTDSTDQSDEVRKLLDTLKDHM